MSQFTKDTVTKTLVRNVVQKLPPAPSNSSVPIPQIEPSELTKIEPKFKKIVVASVPSSNSTNLIVQNIKTVKSKKSMKIKSVSELDDPKQLAIQEKLTRQMNFPHEQAIYKDLIPLCVKVSSAPSITSRDPLPPKDIEPKLSDFHQHTSMPEFNYIIPPRPTSSSGSLIYDGLKIDRLMCNWNLNN